MVKGKLQASQSTAVCCHISTTKICKIKKIPDQTIIINLSCELLLIFLLFFSIYTFNFALQSVETQNNFKIYFDAWFA